MENFYLGRNEQGAIEAEERAKKRREIEIDKKVLADEKWQRQREAMLANDPVMRKRVEAKQRAESEEPAMVPIRPQEEVEEVDDSRGAQDARVPAQEVESFKPMVERVVQDPLEVTGAISDESGRPSVDYDLGRLPDALRSESELIGDMSLEKSKAIDEELEREKGRMKRIEENRASSQEMMDHWENKSAEIEEKVENQKITEPNIWGSASTGGKIMLSLGAVLSSFNSQSAQAFRTSIDNAVKRDIERQKALFQKDKDALTRSESMFGKYFKLYQNADMAEQAVMVTTDSLMQRNLERIKVNNQGKLASVNADKMIAKLEVEGMQKAKELQIKTQEQAIKLRKQKAELDIAEGRVEDSIINDTEFVGKITDPSQNKEFRDKRRKLKQVETGIATLRDIWENGSFETRKGDAERAKSTMAGALAGLYDLGPRQAAEIEKTLPHIKTGGNLKTFFSSDVGSLENSLDGIKSALEEAYPIKRKKRISEQEEQFIRD